jgi:hypothetical protein
MKNYLLIFSMFAATITATAQNQFQVIAGVNASSATDHLALSKNRLPLVIGLSLGNKKNNRELNMNFLFVEKTIRDKAAETINYNVVEFDLEFRKWFGVSDWSAVGGAYLNQTLISSDQLNTDGGLYMGVGAKVTKQIIIDLTAWRGLVNYRKTGNRKSYIQSMRVTMRYNFFQ